MLLQCHLVSQHLASLIFFLALKLSFCAFTLSEVMKFCSRKNKFMCKNIEYQRQAAKLCKIPSSAIEVPSVRCDVPYFRTIPRNQSSKVLQVITTRRKQNKWKHHYSNLTLCGNFYAERSLTYFFYFLYKCNDENNGASVS